MMLGGRLAMSRSFALPLVLAGLFGLRLPLQGANRKLLEPIHPGAVNSGGDEDDPHLSSSALSLFYTVRTAPGLEVFTATRPSPTSPWGKGKPHPDLPADGADVRGVFLTPDGTYPQYLYFATNRHPEKEGK